MIHTLASIIMHARSFFMTLWHIHFQIKRATPHTHEEEGCGDDGIKELKLQFYGISYHYNVTTLLALLSNYVPLMPAGE
jgi:hypothetical protein